MLRSRCFPRWAVAARSRARRSGALFMANLCHPPWRGCQTKRTCVCTARLAGLLLPPCSLRMADELGLYSSCTGEQHKARLFLGPEGVRGSWRRSARTVGPGGRGRTSTGQPGELGAHPWSSVSPKGW